MPPADAAARLVLAARRGGADSAAGCSARRDTTVTRPVVARLQAGLLCGRLLAARAGMLSALLEEASSSATRPVSVLVGVLVSPVLLLFRTTQGTGLARTGTDTAKSSFLGGAQLVRRPERHDRRRRRDALAARARPGARTAAGAAAGAGGAGGAAGAVRGAGGRVLRALARHVRRRGRPGAPRRAVHLRGANSGSHTHNSSQSRRRASHC